MDDFRHLLQIVMGWYDMRHEFRYICDFGDDWNHNLVLEQIEENEDGRIVPVCTEGQGNCPPEDCGGIYGYREFAEAMKKQSTNAKKN